MRVSSIFAESLEPAARRIKSKAINFYADLATRNADHSTFAVTGTVDELSKALNYELKDLFARLNLVRIGVYELKKIRTDLFSFIDVIFSEWKNELINRKAFSVGGETAAQQYEQFISTRVVEAKTIVNFEFLIAEEKIRARRRQFYWDISKIGITAIVGGIIGAYIKTIFP